MKCVYEWFACFQEDRKNVSDKPRSESLVIDVSDESIEKVRSGLEPPKPDLAGRSLNILRYTTVTKNRQLNMLMIADELWIKRESVRQIVTQNLGMRETCYRYWRYSLYPTKLDDAFELHLKGRLLAKFPVFV
ncbi:hypothetical protein TNCV_4049891 [Trichonephila clavipes]|nr:hypothetical protein TNCV_4049891 [Trichonephila clavipes]